MNMGDAKATFGARGVEGVRFELPIVLTDRESWFFLFFFFFFIFISSYRLVYNWAPRVPVSFSLSRDGLNSLEKSVAGA